MKGADIDIAVLQARLGANATCDPLLDLSVQDRFDAFAAMRQAINKMEAETVRELLATRGLLAKSVGG